MAKVLVIYHSDTGNTRRLAELVAEGVRIGGCEATVIQASELDMSQAPGADAFAVGSPDYFSYPAGSVKTFFDRAYVTQGLKGKPLAAFGTHGGGGKVLGVIEGLAKATNFKLVGPGLLIQGKPTSADEPAARELGRKLAEAATQET